MTSSTGVAMTSYSSYGKQVLDQRGKHMADARDDATAEVITMALNTTFPWVAARGRPPSMCFHSDVDFATLTCIDCGKLVH